MLWLLSVYIFYIVTFFISFVMVLFLFNYTATTEIYTYCHPLSLHDALPICCRRTGTSHAATAAARCTSRVGCWPSSAPPCRTMSRFGCTTARPIRSEEHTSELQSLMRISYAVFCLKKKNITIKSRHTIKVKKHIYT